MTRSSMAFHDTEKCPGLVGCETCLDRIWHGRTPVITPTADRIFDVFAGVAIGLAVVYLGWHVAGAVLR